MRNTRSYGINKSLDLLGREIPSQLQYILEQVHIGMGSCMNALVGYRGEAHAYAGVDAPQDLSRSRPVHSQGAAQPHVARFISTALRAR